MRIHRFYVSENIGDKKEITINSREQVNQIHRVFRLGTDDSIIVFYGSGYDYECRVKGFKKDSIQLLITLSSKSRYMPVRDIYLCAGVLKKNTFEWIVEKATELGVTNIIPVMAERSEKKSLNMDRLKKIAIEASEQSGRGDVPMIDEVTKLGDVLSILKDKGGVELIAFHTEEIYISSAVPRGRKSVSPEDVKRWKGETANDGSDTAFSKNGSAIAIFIGPEGGWSPDEISMFHDNGVAFQRLGRQVLRAETAVVSALSLIVFGE